MPALPRPQSRRRRQRLQNPMDLQKDLYQWASTIHRLYQTKRKERRSSMVWVCLWQLLWWRHLSRIQSLHYATTNRDGYREYKSRRYICADCPTREQCTSNVKNEKIVTRHIWSDYVEMAEDARHTPKYKNLYKKRQEKIERVFADAKEKHGMRYTWYRGLAR